ncbi:hypothetical protein GIB67_039786 [Kingdonia uniflora]|uniref:Histone H2A n=1 Tax=Kingdonia uniflora TaxID=39325 RepID=A0A7J7P329_9MAGN|nr:hypothetical protein GIB67_039786 [Kingdonia uniflora]
MHPIPRKSSGGKSPWMQHAAKNDSTYMFDRTPGFLDKAGSGRYAQRLGASAPAFLARAVEYITSEVLELAGNAEKDNRKKMIIPKTHSYGCEVGHGAY